MFSPKYEKQKTIFDLFGNTSKCKNLYRDFYECFSSDECYNSKKLLELLHEIKKEC